MALASKHRVEETHREGPLLCNPHERESCVHPLHRRLHIPQGDEMPPIAPVSGEQPRCATFQKHGVSGQVHAFAPNAPLRVVESRQEALLRLPEKCHEMALLLGPSVAWAMP